MIAVRRAADGFEVCLIRKKLSRTWGIPKGMVEHGQTHEETALNEAWEEAGIKGRLMGDALGTYEYRKWGVVLEVAVYLMHVLEQHAEWDEVQYRDRDWVSFDQAATRLADHAVLPLLERARTRL